MDKNKVIIKSKMPKISSQTVSGLEQKEELSTGFFRLGRHEKKPIDLSSCDTDVQNIISFRARQAIKKQEQDGRTPTEMDQAAAEITLSLQEGKSLNELSPQQIGQIYFILRDSERNEDYLHWVTEGENQKNRMKAKRKEKREIGKIIKKLEKKLTGETLLDLGRSLLSGHNEPRDKLVLNQLMFLL